VDRDETIRAVQLTHLQRVESRAIDHKAEASNRFDRVAWLERSRALPGQPEAQQKAAGRSPGGFN